MRGQFRHDEVAEDLTEINLRPLDRFSVDTVL